MKSIPKPKLELRVRQYGNKKFGYELVAPNRLTVMSSDTIFTRQRSAVAAAKKIAGSAITVVVAE